MDSWLDSVHFDYSGKWFHRTSCGHSASASHQNQRTHRFTCSGGFLCRGVRCSLLFFCDIRGGCNWPQPYASWVDFIRWLFAYASTMNLCSLALDRYMAVVKPLKYVNFMTARRVTQLTFFSWLITLGFAIFSVIMVSKSNVFFIYNGLKRMFYSPWEFFQLHVNFLFYFHGNSCIQTN